MRDRIDRQDLAREAVLAQEALRPRCRLAFRRRRRRSGRCGSVRTGRRTAGWDGSCARVYSAHDPSPHFHRRIARRRPAGAGPGLAQPSRSSSSCPTRPAARPTSSAAWWPNISASGSARTSSSRTGPARAPWSAPSLVAKARARRLHAPDVDDLGPVDLAAALWRRRLRPDGGLHPHLARLAQSQRPGGQSRASRPRPSRTTSPMPRPTPASSPSRPRARARATTCWACGSSR